MSGDDDVNIHRGSRARVAFIQLFKFSLAQPPQLSVLKILQTIIKGGGGNRLDPSL